MVYNNLSGYLKGKYGHRLKKICVDGGFSCPNRDGKLSTGGCIFCGERGAGEHIDNSISIREQVESAILSAKDDDEFIVYFQNFTNTYADVSTLKNRYDAALISDRIKVLSIGTRPDCIDEEKARLIASYQDKYEVWIELGLQTANDKTAAIINRSYPLSVFENAISILNKYSIKTVVHMIIGLPSEGPEDFLATAKYIIGKHPFGIKIHSLYVMKGTRLEVLYHQKRYTPIGFDEYTDTVSEILKMIPPDIVIHRLTGDCPRGLLVAPEWSLDKNEVLKAIQDKLKTV